MVQVVQGKVSTPYKTAMKRLAAYTASSTFHAPCGDLGSRLDVELCCAWTDRQTSRKSGEESVADGITTCRSATPNVEAAAFC